MCRVLLGEEVVNFEGHMPEKLQEALFFLEDFLNNNGKTLSAVKVDDKNFSVDQAELYLSGFEKVECQCSKKNRVALENAMCEFEKNLKKITTILAANTEEVLQISQEFTLKLQTFLTVLQQENYLSFVFQEKLYSQILQNFIENLEKKDFGLLFDCIEFGLTPLFKETCSLCTNE